MTTARLLTLALALACVSCAAACGASSGAGWQSKQERRWRATAEAGAPVTSASPAQIATLEDRRVNESSGIVASRRNPGLFWTHNDSGDGPFVYAFDRRGRRRGTWRVAGAQARDWEDIAAGPGPEASRAYLYAGDIGDNDEEREFIVVYRFPEPEIADADAASTRESPRATAAAEAIRIKYPDGAHNCEALLVHPTTGDLYVVTKAGDSAGVYKLAAPFDASKVNTFARVATLRGPGFFGTLVTGADISPDGRRVALCDYAGGYELTPPEGSKGFDDVWAQKPTLVPLGARKQGESVCYRLDGAALLATSEGTPTPLFEVVLREQKGGSPAVREGASTPAVTTGGSQTPSLTVGLPPSPFAFLETLRGRSAGGLESRRR
ncbi:MAG TPA: hypothetical protein VM936_15740 [Pyrinomonadaceae bacterium]|nr:hypothetical protein [Pyrinomonadaceae bacterium]